MIIPANVINNHIVVIGASTGGVEATRTVLRALPVNMPGIVVVQHMPEGFTAMYAQSLEQELPFHVSESVDGARVEPGCIYIGRAGRQLRIQKSGGGFIMRMGGEEKVSGHCPSVDVLFESTAVAAGPRAVGIIMTGMGEDGARGLLQMRKAGAYTIGQNQESCMVYGMPRKAYEYGAVKREAGLKDIPEVLLLNLMGS